MKTTISRWQVMKGRPFLIAAIFLSLCMVPQISLAGVCANQTDPAIVYCEDFSGPNPLANYTINNPVDGDLPFTSISVINQTLQWVNNPSGFAVALVAHNTPVNVRDTSLEADVQFKTSIPLRSAMGVTFVGAPGSASNEILYFLQLDEQRAYFLLRIAGVTQAYESTYFPSLVPNKTYRLRLEIVGTTEVRGYVDGVLLFDNTYNLSGLPALMYPGFEGSAYGYPAETQVYANAIARHHFNLNCVGFAPPMDKGPVIVRQNRALPFKAQLFDQSGTAFTDTQLGSAPPVINVSYDAGTGSQPTDVTALAVPAGLGTPGNQFVFADGVWQFNLKTTNYTAPGTYRVTILPGDSYTIEPACSGSFVIK
jgi:hypothetical protein